MTEPRFKKGDLVVWPQGMPCTTCKQNHRVGVMHTYAGPEVHASVEFVPHPNYIAVHPSALYHPAEWAILQAINPKEGL